MRAYHFLKDNMKAGSGNEKAWKIGEERIFKGDIVMCQRGYHSSPSWYDTLSYAPGSMACIVEIPRKGTKKDPDKSVSPKRKLVDARNAGTALRLWGCDCAERALKNAKVTDERSWTAIKVARLFAYGKATKAELAAASWDAASAEIKWQKKRLNWYMNKLFKGEM